jgi:hypothetical protein
MAASNVGGYFYGSLLNPLVFSFSGPVQAGRLGMSLSLANAVGTLALAWVSTKFAPFGTLIAKRDFKKLDLVFFRSMWQSLALAVGISGLLLAILSYLQRVHNPLAARVLEPNLFGIMLISTFLAHVVYCEAFYLRAHKKEPFLVLSLVGGLAMAGSMYVMARQFGVVGVVIGYLVTYIFVGFLPGNWLFMVKRREWHRQEAEIEEAPGQREVAQA